MPTLEDVPEIGPEQVDAVLRFLPVFEELEVNFGRWVSQEGGPSKFTISQEATDFIRTCSEQRIIFSFDWPAWKAEAAKYYSDPDALGRADLMVLRKLLTTHIRQDRFSDGHLTHMFESGHLTAILIRMKVIREGMD